MTRGGKEEIGVWEEKRKVKLWKKEGYLVSYEWV